MGRVEARGRRRGAAPRFGGAGEDAAIRHPPALPAIRRRRRQRSPLPGARHRAPRRCGGGRGGHGAGCGCQRGKLKSCELADELLVQHGELLSAARAAAARRQAISCIPQFGRRICGSAAPHNTRKNLRATSKLGAVF